MGNNGRPFSEQALAVVLVACVVPMPSQCPKDASTLLILPTYRLHCVPTMEPNRLDMFPTGTILRFSRSNGDLVVATVDTLSKHSPASYASNMNKIVYC